jgi:hypothetical protein
MEFKKFSAGKQSYGLGTKPPADEIQEDNVNFYDPKLKEISSSKHDDYKEDKEVLIDVIMALATCHTVIWDEKKQ